ncbi:MAG: hypothetical protein AAF928_21075, partial [Myxococcota bacterium]
AAPASVRADATDGGAFNATSAPTTSPERARHSADDLSDGPPRPEAAPTRRNASSPAPRRSERPSRKRSRFLGRRRPAAVPPVSSAQAMRPDAGRGATESATPEASAPAGRGKLVAMAIGASCVFTVDGQTLGKRSSVQKEVTSGPHTVTCAVPGGATQTRTVNVVPGKAAAAVFRF